MILIHFNIVSSFQCLAAALSALSNITILGAIIKDESMYQGWLVQLLLDVLDLVK